MLRNPHYRLLHFVIMVRRAQMKGDRGRGAAAFARAVLVPVRNLVAFIVSDEKTQALLQELSTYFGISQQTPLSAVVVAVATKGPDTTVRAIVWKLIRATWRHGLLDLWRLRKPLRRPMVQEGTAGRVESCVLNPRDGRKTGGMEMRRKTDWSPVLFAVGAALVVCALHDDVRRSRGELDRCILPAVLAGLRAVFFGGAS